MNNAKSFDTLDSWRDEFLIQASPRDPDSFPFVGCTSDMWARSTCANCLGGIGGIGEQDRCRGE